MLVMQPENLTRDLSALLYHAQKNCADPFLFVLKWARCRRLGPTSAVLLRYLWQAETHMWAAEPISTAGEGSKAVPWP